MSVLTDRIKLVGSKGEKKLYALFDNGATFSFIERKLAEKLGLIDKLAEPMKFEMAKQGEKFELKERVTLDFYIEGIRLSDEFMIIDKLVEEVIIGAATLQKWRLKLDFEQERVIVDQRVTRLMLV